jgi:short-subunit dehydrogenase involved in D-alanine esterification of teichoic acids
MNLVLKVLAPSLIHSHEVSLRCQLKHDRLKSIKRINGAPDTEILRTNETDEDHRHLARLHETEADVFQTVPLNDVSLDKPAEQVQSVYKLFT